LPAIQLQDNYFFYFFPSEITKIMSEHIKMNVPPPRTQAIILGGAALIFMLVGRFVLQKPDFAWTSSGAFLLFFIVFNNGAAIFTANYGKYVQQAVPTFLALLVAMGLLATLISGISIYDKPAFRTIYIIMIMAYFSLMALAFFVRKAADFLHHRDQEMHED
jgi:hypothetical protein